MTVAVSRAAGRRRRGGDLRLDRQHGGERRRLRGARRAARRGDRPRGQDRDRQARPGADARRPRDRAARQLRPGAARSSASSPTRHPVELVNSVNPYRIEGQKTAAFEVVEELGEAPDALAIPVGNAGNVTAWQRGFAELGVAAGALRLSGRGRRAARPRRAGRRARRRSPRRSGSATRRAGRRRWPRSPARAGGSRRSPTSRSSTPTGCSPRARGSSASRPRRPRSPGSSPTACRCAEGAAAPRDGRLRAHRPRAQGPRHGARQGAGGDRLRGRPRRGRARRFRLMTRSDRRARSPNRVGRSRMGVSTSYSRGAWRSSACVLIVDAAGACARSSAATGRCSTTCRRRRSRSSTTTCGSASPAAPARRLRRPHAGRDRGQVPARPHPPGPARAAADPLPRRAARRAALVRVPLDRRRAATTGSGSCRSPTPRERSPAGSRSPSTSPTAARWSAISAAAPAESTRSPTRPGRWPAASTRPPPGSRSARGRAGSPAPRSRRCSSPAPGGAALVPEACVGRRPATGSSCRSPARPGRRSPSRRAEEVFIALGDGEAEADREFMRRARRRGRCSGTR